MFLLDPYHNWLTSWEHDNPELIYPTKWDQRWSLAEALVHIEWLDRRWEAFKQAFPEWKQSVVLGLRDQ